MDDEKEARCDWRRLGLAAAIVAVTFALPGCPVILIPALVVRHFLTEKDRPDIPTSTAQPEPGGK